MSDIGPGDYVLCVDADTPSVPRGRFLDQRRPVTGAHYFVSAAFVNPRGDPSILIGWERESMNRVHGGRWGYGLHRFRKIGPGDTAHLDRSLKRPAVEGA